MSPAMTISYLLIFIYFLVTGQLPGQGPDGHELQGTDIIYYNDGHDLDGYGEWKYVVYQAEMDGGGNCRFPTLPLIEESRRSDPGPVVTMQSAVQTTTCLTEVIIWFPADGIDYNPITGNLFNTDPCVTPESGYTCESVEVTAVFAPATPSPTSP